MKLRPFTIYCGILFLSVALPLVAQTYPEIIKGDNPVHYWRFEEADTGTPAADEQGNRDGAYEGGITLGEDSSNPGLGKAARFDGANGTHVSLGEPLHPGDSVSVEAWVNLDEDVTTGFAPVMARWGGSYELDFNMSQEYRGNMVAQGNGVAVPKTTDPLELGTWHHVVGIFAGDADGGGGTATIYLDGVQGEEIVDGGNLADGGGDDGLWYIGRTRTPTSGFAWKGLLDEVALYDRALTEAEILEHFEAGKPEPFVLLPSEGNVYAFIDDDLLIEVDTGIIIEAGKTYTLKVDTGNPPGEEGQGDSSLQAWVLPSDGGAREFIGQNFRTQPDWKVAPDGGWVENTLTFSGDANSLTGNSGPVAGGSLVILSTNFDAGCCGGGEPGRVYFDNYRVEVDDVEAFMDGFEGAGLNAGEEGTVADAGWSGAGGLFWPVGTGKPIEPEPDTVPDVDLPASDGNVIAFIDDDSTIEVDTGIVIEAGKSYTLKVDAGNPAGDPGQGDSSLQAWVIPSGGGEKEFIGQNFRTLAEWNVAPDGGWVENSFTFSGDASSLTGGQGPVAGGSLVVFSSNFDASCCGGGEPGSVFFDNFRVDVDGVQVFQESFEAAGVTEEGGAGELADAGWSGDPQKSGIFWPIPGPLLPVAIGGSFIEGATNLALSDNGAVASSPDPNIADPFGPENANNGIYGLDNAESKSWISAEANSSIIIDLSGESSSVSLIAWSSDNTAAISNRVTGTYTVEFTNDAAVSPDSAWIELGFVTFTTNTPTDLVRHLYQFDPFDATGIRIRTESAGAQVAIDEIEVYPAGTVVPIPFELLESVEIGGTMDAASNLALATNGGIATSPDANIADPFGPENTINGIYGLDSADSKAWISAEGNSSILIALPNQSLINRVAWGSDNTAAINNRVTGTYILESTNDDNVTPDSSWVEIGRTTFATNTPEDLMRHVYQFVPVQSTGIRIVTQSVGPQIAIDEIEIYAPIPMLQAVVVGGSFIEGATNLALAANGATALSPDANIADPFGPENAINGIYGLDNAESKSWISAEAKSAIIVDLAGGSSSIGLVAWSSDNTGAINNRVLGTYTLAFTNDPAVSADSNWTTLGRVIVSSNNVEDLARHVYAIDPAVDATGIRIVTESNGPQIAIDEIEVYPAGTNPFPPQDSRYADAVIADRPVHYWRFEESSTDEPARDAIGNQDGEYAGEIELGQESFSPILGSAIHLDGENDTHVDLGEEGPQVGASITVEAWINLDDDSTAQFAPIVARWDGGFELDVNNPDGGFVDMVIRNDSNQFIDPASDVPLELGSWHHVIGMFDGESDDGNGIGRVYLDGVLGTEIETGGDLQDAGGDDGHWYIGRTRTTTSGFGWRGFIDEVAIYDYALTEEQILNHIEVAMGGGVISRFEITSVVRSAENGNVTISWTSNPGRTYTIQTSTSLEDPWIEVADSVEASDGPETFFTDTEATIDLRELYYRVLEEEL